MLNHVEPTIPKCFRSFRRAVQVEVEIFVGDGGLHLPDLVLGPVGHVQRQHEFLRFSKVLGVPKMPNMDAVKNSWKIRKFEIHDLGLIILILGSVHVFFLLEGRGLFATWFWLGKKCHVVLEP